MGSKRDFGIDGLVAAACIAAASARAWTYRWTCDDAFISFRYAKNLVDGHGLVFNPGERVEGYTNFLWTLWLVPGFWLHVEPETWAAFWGTCALGGTALLLFALHRRLAPSGHRRLLVPFAAVGAAAHTQWVIFATGGLETTAFTFFVVSGFAALVWPGGERPVARGALSGLAFSLAILNRPDGVVFGAVAGAWLVAQAAFARLRPLHPWHEANALRGAKNFVIAALAMAIVAGAIVGSHLAWRLSYYGDPLPNTYYAKSGQLSWYSQGVYYLWLYLLGFPLFALAPVAFAAMWRAKEKVEPSQRLAAGAAVLAAAMGTAHAFWVVRVGGDFMFARFLVPSAPLFLFVFDALAMFVVRQRPYATHAAVGLGAISLAVVPTPIPPDLGDHGIADERAYYSAERVARMEKRAADTKAALAGLDVRVAFYGTQARLVYRAEIPTAIECETGLTDRFVAHQALDARGRVGHEKHAPAHYIVDVRKAHLAIGWQGGPKVSRTDEYIPFLPLNLGESKVQLLHWDAAFVDALRRRGFEVPDYPRRLDEMGPELEAFSPEKVQFEYERAKRFYFQFVPDPAREARFRERLAAHPSLPRRGDSP